MEMEIKVYDWEGNERDLAYLRGKYGDFIIQDAAEGEGLAFKISALREKVETAATLVVTVADDEGNPLEGVRVAWYWPDADVDPNAGPKGGVPQQMRPERAISGTTNMNGDVGFGMGGGAYFWPDQGEIGPHATWIHGPETRSDLIYGLGMIAATNHNHFDVEYRQTLLEEEEPVQTEGVRYYDETSKERDAAWAKAQFGAQSVHKPDALPRFKLIALHAASGEHQTLSPRVLDADGEPMAGVTVGIGPRDIAGEPQTAVTDEEGYAAFPLSGLERHSAIDGQGHYVCAIVGEASDVYESAGVVMATQPPRWLNPVFQYAREEGETPPQPETGCPTEEIEAELAKIEQAVQAIRELLAT
jgi:hypothetical protein